MLPGTPEIQRLCAIPQSVVFLDSLSKNVSFVSKRDFARLKTLIFHCSFHSNLLGAASGTAIVKLDILIGGPAGDAGRAG